MLDFKAQDVKYCQCCGQYLGSRKELGDAVFNPLKYCPTCKKEVHREQKAAYRKRCKQVEQLNTLRQQLEKCNRKLLRYIQTLEE